MHSHQQAQSELNDDDAAADDDDDEQELIVLLVTSKASCAPLQLSLNFHWIYYFLIYTNNKTIVIKLRTN